MTLAHLSLLAAGTLGTALGLFTCAVGTAPLPPPEHLGLRGYKRFAARRDNDLFRLFEPTIRYLGRRLYGLLSPAARDRLARQLILAGHVAGLRAEEVVALRVLLGAVLGGLGAYCGRADGRVLLLLSLGAGLGAALPSLFLESVKRKRLENITTATPGVVDLLTLSLGAGLDFPAALRQVVESETRIDEALHEELELVLQDLSVGRTRRWALGELANRAPCEPIQDLVSATIQAEEQGTPLADVLRIQAKMARLKRTRRAEEIAAKAANKMFLPLLLLFFGVFILILGPTILRMKDQLGS